jgi:hypothetical protein
MEKNGQFRIKITSISMVSMTQKLPTLILLSYRFSRQAEQFEESDGYLDSIKQ